MIRLIKHFQNPTYFPEQWTTENPLLKIGQVGFERDVSTGKVVRHKVGPGRWNDLSYEDSSIYSYVDEVTNPIGDISSLGDISGKTTSEILHLILSPYQVPSITGLLNNAGTGFQNIQTRQVGQSLSGTVTVTWTLNNSGNLSGSNPVNISAGGLFNNEGSFPNTGSAVMNLSSPLNPTIISEYDISLTLSHIKGTTSPYKTKIRFWPKIMWITSPLADMPDGATFMAVINRQESVSNSYQKDYFFQGNGYNWLAIPAMLGPLNLKYAEVSNPLVPSPYGITEKGQLTINNGVTSYLYTLVRSTYFLNNPTTLRVG